MPSEGDRRPPGSAPVHPGLPPARSASGDVAEGGQNPPSPQGQKVSHRVLLLPSRAHVSCQGALGDSCDLP